MKIEKGEKRKKLSVTPFFVIFWLAAILFGEGLAPNCQATPLDIQWAGFAFRGDSAHIQKNYPYVYKISDLKMEDSNQTVLNNALIENIKNIQLRNGNLVINDNSNIDLANLGEGTLTLACCLDNEMVTIDEYDGERFKIVIDLGAQILLFDYDQMKIVASYPLAIQLIDFSKKKPTEDMIRKRIKDLLLTNKYDINLFREFSSHLANIELKRSYGNTIKVTDVIIEDKAKPFLPPRFLEYENKNFKIFVAQSFGKFLSKNQAVSVLPYTKGSDIGNTMAVRFSGGEDLQLEIPDSQFEVELTIRGFKKILTDETAAEACWVYGAYVHVLVFQPLLEKIYLDEKIKNGVVKIVPAMQKKVADWPVFQESLMVLWDKMTKKFSEERKYKKIREVFKKCK